MRRLVICSGGLDSVTLAYKLASQGPIDVVSFDYGQRHRKELGFARLAADRLAATHTVIPIDVGRHLAGSSLTDDSVDVPFGHYADEMMKATIVPNRNAIMLSIAAGVAIARDIEEVGYAAHAGDHPIYPDCRPQFVDAMNALLAVANDAPVRIVAPFIHSTKADIVRIGAGLGVPFHDTWSCYVGGLTHCAQCGTCVERIEAFKLAGVPDPTTYLGWPVRA